MQENLKGSKNKKKKLKKCLIDDNQIEEIKDNVDQYSFNFEKIYHKAKKRNKKSLMRLKRPYREAMDERT